MRDRVVDDVLGRADLIGELDRRQRRPIVTE
jgi:hypothetical protein